VWVFFSALYTIIFQYGMAMQNCYVNCYLGLLEVRCLYFVLRRAPVITIIFIPKIYNYYCYNYYYDLTILVTVICWFDNILISAQS